MFCRDPFRPASSWLTDCSRNLKKEMLRAANSGLAKILARVGGGKPCAHRPLIIAHQALYRWDSKSNQMEMLIQDSRIRWADALCFGPEGKLFLADSAIPEQMLQSKEPIEKEQPYFVWVIDYDGLGVPGQ